MTPRIPTRADAWFNWRRSIRQYKILLGAGIRIELQYRANLLLTAFGAVAYQGATLAFVGILLHRFGALGGWSFSEVGCIFGLRMASHGLMTVMLGQLWEADQLIREGEFDRYLVRPVNPFIQVITRRFTLPSLGDLALGVVVLALTASHAPIGWSPLKVAYLVMAVVGGSFLEGALLTFASGLEFRLLSTHSLKSFVDGILTSFGPYPLSAFNSIVALTLTFVVPLAFIAYFPSSVLLERTAELRVWPSFAYLSPLAGPLLFGASCWFFTRQMRYYSSPGH